jgi:two-component system OmpR family sensor kinase
LDINLLKREKTTLFSFLALYTFLTIVIITIVSFLYYNFQKDLVLQKKRDELYRYSNDIILILKYMHINFEENNIYPRDDRFKSAIYDSDRTLIFSTLENKEVDLEKNIYTKNSKIHFINQPDSYYLGTKYIVIEVDDDGAWLQEVKRNILLYGLGAFAFMIIAGYFLLKLFIRPLKDALHLLDRFIKDTTHELNTPVSTIVANVEMIDKDLLDEKTAKKINRIDIGAKTISNIYEDLTFLTLNNKLITKDEKVDMGELLKQRIEYFKTIADGKKIDITLDIKESSSLLIDRRKISRLIDNLISNAVKYNKIKGKIDIVLKSRSFYIEDSGIGIEQHKIEKMFERYTRFDKSAGGFGIGLSIVASICEEYGLKINITSKPNKGTKVYISW